ncbi:MAG: peptide chain release factor N(5)-glutamine methyltransferase [Treponema sp.]|jgi:release factor glutamine methyltransferase|nr:peptide chain release factor N(5)-glutamine methyltransferase [Treponema sp.]
MTIREALASGSAALAAAGIESHSLDASLLLAEVLTISRTSLLAAAPDSLSENHFAAFEDYIKRRLAGECVAYILGRKEFRGLEFAVNPAVLVPRPETETLVEVTRQQLAKGKEQLTEKNQPLRVLDLCTGSGAIAIALKHEMPELEIWAADISAQALEIATANAARLLPPDSITFCHGNLFDALPKSLFSIIVSNPPYVTTAEIAGLSPEVRAEPILALDGGNDGLDIIRTIIAKALDFLCPGGALLLEADPRQMKHIAALLENRGFMDIQIHRDLSGERVILGNR